MKRSLRLILVLVLVVPALLALVPAPANAGFCDDNPNICAPLKFVRPYLDLCEFKVLGCGLIVDIIWSTPQPNANCNDALQYADTPPDTQTELRWAEFAIVCLVNQERTNAGRANLSIDSRLVTAARNHAQDIVVHNPTDQHRGSDGSQVGTRVTRAGYAWRSVGENIFSLRGNDGTLQYRDSNGNLQTCVPPNGQINTAPREVVRGWMCSSGHRNNIVNGAFRDTGVGAVFGYSRVGSDTATSSEQYPPVTYVQVFAQPA